MVPLPVVRCVADVRVRNNIAIERGKLENVCVNTRRLVGWILLVSAVGGGLAACSSGTSTTTSTPSSPTAAAPSATSTGSSSTGAESAITTNWEAFFNPQTPVAKRVSLLQHGSLFASVIRAQAGSSLASQASAKVTKVTVTSPTQADVTYTILLAGAPVLKNQHGVAVNEGGTWKVGVTSFCGLLTVENNGKTPSVCKAAG